jgi:ribonuclease R
VTSFGVFVTLDEMYVEGLVHITELGGEYFRFDEARQELRGERTGTRYAIGTRVRIQVSRVDLDGRKIDFRLVHDGDGFVARFTQDKGTGRVPKSRTMQAEHFDIDAGLRTVSFKKEVGKRTSGKPARASKSTDRSLPVSQKKAARKRR